MLGSGVRRRRFLQTATSLAMLQPADNAATAGRAYDLDANESIQAAAARKGLNFGTAVNITSLRRDPRYGPTIASDCGIIVPENAMKMEYVEPVPGSLRFSDADETYAFAQRNRLRLRGTTLVWHRGMPDWARNAIASGSGEAIMRHWIGVIVSRYRGHIESWDVINEVVDLSSGRADGLRQTLWLSALGPGYLELAFHLSAEADPSAAGLWNEDDLELDAKWIDDRRSTVLRILEHLIKQGVPIKRLGLQSHLNSLLPFNPDKLRSFLSSVASMGLGIEITELDIDDRAFPPDIAKRDQGVSDLTRRYMDVVLDEPAVLNVLTWDIIDRNTWYNTSNRRRPDGLPQRSLPIGPDYVLTPMHSALRQAFLDAPDYTNERNKLRTS